MSTKRTPKSPKSPIKAPDTPLVPGEKCYHKGQLPMLTLTRGAMDERGDPMPGHVVCMWFDSHNELHYGTFKRSELTRKRL